MLEGHMKAVAVTNPGIDHAEATLAQDVPHLILALEYISLGWNGRCSISMDMVDIGWWWDRNRVGHSHNVVGILHLIIPRIVRRKMEWMSLVVMMLEVKRCC